MLVASMRAAGYAFFSLPACARGDGAGELGVREAGAREALNLSGAI